VLLNERSDTPKAERKNAATDLKQSSVRQLPLSMMSLI
jgi:hypothetical protein